MDRRLKYFDRFVGKGSAVIILFNSRHEILLQLRDENAPTAPNMWSFFGGGMEAGETPEENIKRECLEELGYELKAPQLCMARKHLKHPFFDTDFIFVEPIDDTEIPGLILGEGKAMGWFPFAEAQGLQMVKDKKVLLPAIFEFIGCYYPIGNSTV